MLAPVPAVSLVAYGVTYTLTAGTAGATVLDDLTAPWGRSHLTDHHAPGTAKFSLWTDGAGPGPIIWTSKNRLGNPVTLSWSVTDPVAGPVTRIFFRGRVSGMEVTPDTRRIDGRTVHGARVDFEAASTLAELGNRLTDTAAWPDETGTARMDRIRALVVPSVVASVAYRDFWAGAPMAARNVSSTDALTLLKGMYDTAGGDRMAYDPHANTIFYVRRRKLESTATDRYATLRKAAAVDPSGVYVHALNVGTTTPSWPMLNARLLEATADGKLSGDVGTRVTRITYSWTEPVGVRKTRVLTDTSPTGAETTLGVSTATLDTELRNSGYADTAGSDWLDILWWEGAQLTFPPMVYRADRAGGFPSLLLAQLLIGGTELIGGPADISGTASLCYLVGTPYPGQALRVVPIGGVMGGTVRYVAGGWRPTIHLARHSMAIWQTSTPMVTRLQAKDLYANATRDRFRASEWGDGVTIQDLYFVGSQ